VKEPCILSSNSKNNIKHFAKKKKRIIVGQRDIILSFFFLSSAFVYISGCAEREKKKRTIE
jgi:hypothetical protein